MYIFDGEFDFVWGNEIRMYVSKCTLPSDIGCRVEIKIV